MVKTKPTEGNSSDLESHKKRKWGLESPMNASFGDTLQTTQWAADRLPEFLYWDALVQEHGDAAFEIGGEVIDILETVIAKGPQPPLALCTDFSRVPQGERDQVRGRIRGIRGSLPPRFADSVKAIENHPMRWLVEGEPSEQNTDPEEFLDGQVIRLWNRRDGPAVTVQQYVLVQAAKRGHIRFQAGQGVLVDALIGYPRVKDAGLAAAAINSLGLAFWNLRMKESSWPPTFWTTNRKRTMCTVSLPEVDSFVRSAASEASASESREMQIPVLRSNLVKLTRLAAFHGEEPDVSEAVLGLAGRMVRIVEDVAAHAILRASPWGHVFVRLAFEHLVDAVYILRGGSEVAQRYKEYGRGQLKLAYKKMEDFAQNIPESDKERYLRSVEGLKNEANAESNEEFTDIRWDDWTGANLRKRAEEVGLAEQYRILYGQMSQDVHCTWGSARRLELTTCMVPSHGGHLVPWRGFVEVSTGTLALLVDMNKQLQGEINARWSPRPSTSAEGPSDPESPVGRGAGGQRATNNEDE